MFHGREKIHEVRLVCSMPNVNERSAYAPVTVPFAQVC